MAGMVNHIELAYKLEFDNVNRGQLEGEVVHSNTVTRDGVCWQMEMTKVVDRLGFEQLHCQLQMVLSSGQKSKLARICLLAGGPHQSSTPILFQHSGDKSESITFSGKGWVRLGIEVFKHLEVVNPTPPIKTEMANVALNWFNTEGFGDLTIVAANGKEFHCHKDILAARSEVFRLMFSLDMKESKENLVNLDIYSEEVVAQLLVFVYTNECEIGPIADRLYAAAHQYELDRLKILCESALITNLSAETVVKTYRLARFYHLDQLLAVCVDFLDSNKAKLPVGDIFIEAMKIEDEKEAETEQK